MTAVLNLKSALVLALGLSIWMPTDSTAAPNCGCRVKGQSVQVGKCACLKLNIGFKRACCQMVLNNPSWRISSEDCVMAENSPPMSPVPAPDSVVKRSPPNEIAIEGKHTLLAQN